MRSETEAATTKQVFFSYTNSAFANVDFIPENLLEFFPDFHNLRISKSNLEVVPDSLFGKNLEFLRLLCLDSGNIKEIHKDAFSNLINLEWIGVHNNKIEAVSGNIFLRNVKLKYIFMYGNKIKMILPTIFSTLNGLLNVYLGGNVCIDATYTITNGDKKGLSTGLKTCYQNCLEDLNCVKGLWDSPQVSQNRLESLEEKLTNLTLLNSNLIEIINQERKTMQSLQEKYEILTSTLEHRENVYEQSIRLIIDAMKSNSSLNNEFKQKLVKLNDSSCNDIDANNIAVAQDRENRLIEMLAELQKSVNKNSEEIMNFIRSLGGRARK
jgi:hypothetical protein